MDLSNFIVIFPVIALSCLTLADECVKTGPCSCQTSTKVVNLSPLIAGSQSNPRFSFIKVTYNYTFEPCQPLKQCNGMTDVAVCQSSTNVGGQTFSLGKSNTAAFSGSPDLNNVVLKYTNGDEGRLANVKLTCASVETFQYVDEKPIKTYNLELRTPYACGINIPVIPPSSGLSAGSVLLILFFVFLVVYFVAGFLFLKFARGAQGVETIPNYEFWTELPGLIKDGVQFTCRGCKSDSSYSQI